MTGPSTTREGTPRQLLAFSAIFALAGAQVAWAAYTRQPALRVPPSVGYLVAVVLLAASAAGAAKASGRRRVVEAVVVVIFAGFAAIGWWLSLASDGGCTTNLPLSGAARVLGCRFGFGLGALVSSASALRAGALWWRGRDRG